MKNKIKYLNFEIEHDIEWLKEDFKIVDNPTSFTNLPDGEYLIRGDKKHHSKEYYKIGDIWFLISENTKDNGHYNCIAATYTLFPCLKEKEWENLTKVYNKLSPYWKRAVYGRNFWMELRKLRRDLEYSYYKHNK